MHVLLRDEQESLTGVPPGQVYARLGKRFLILGEPGAGKTTMLLELASDLLADPLHAPVVLSLSSWPAGDVKFEQWVAGELHRFYDLPEHEARHVVDRGVAALLLDGLDEVPRDRLKTCVKALNDFRTRRGDTPVAVTCRVADYDEHVQPLLHLVGAVEIQRLSPDEIDGWLAGLGPAVDDLRRAAHSDEGLRDLLRTPLALNIAALAYRDRKVDAFTGLDSLLAAYTTRMLDRPRAALADTKTYAESDVRRWLASLARGMTAANAATISPRMPERFRAVWIDTAIAPMARLPRALLMLGALPMALLAGITTSLIGPWWAAPVVAVLTLCTAMTSRRTGSPGSTPPVLMR